MMGSFGVWGWLALGLALIAVEVLLLPGGFPLWIGIAALVMAGVTLVTSLNWQVELVVFGALAVVASIVAWKVHYRASRSDAADGFHDRVEQLIGREFDLDEAIDNGFGRVRIDDTFWRVSGPELPAGTRVKVVGVDGATLRVTSV